MPSLELAADWKKVVLTEMVFMMFGTEKTVAECGCIHTALTLHAHPGIPQSYPQLPMAATVSLLEI